MNKIDLSDKVAVVTGGAQGFGHAIANRFIKSGAKVVIWDNDEEILGLDFILGNASPCCQCSIARC